MRVSTSSTYQCIVRQLFLWSAVKSPCPISLSQMSQTVCYQSYPFHNNDLSSRATGMIAPILHYHHHYQLLVLVSPLTSRIFHRHTFSSKSIHSYLRQTVSLPQLSLHQPQRLYLDQTKLPSQYSHIRIKT